MIFPGILVWLLFFLWGAFLAKSLFFVVYLWQLKEYRWDRLLAHFADREARKIFWRPLSLMKWALLLFSVVWVAMGNALNLVDDVMAYIIFMVYALELVLLLKHLKNKTLRQPIWTKKAQLLWGSVMVVYFLWLYNWFAYEINWDINRFGVLLMPVADFFLPIITTVILMLILNPISWVGKKIYIARARRKIASLENLQVIGITGSYGKSTTKEFLYSILKDSYNTLRTPKTINTEIGVAQVILNELHDEHQVFIVEMGAYRKGEIKAICDLVQPKIGVLTAIGPQHLALFKSIENIVTAKFELLHSLGKNGVAVVNGDDSRIMNALPTVMAKQLTYGINGRDLAIQGSSIQLLQNGQSQMKVTGRKSSFMVTVPILGNHLLTNLLGAIGAARAVGMPVGAIEKAITSVHCVSRRMESVSGKKGSLIIDDTYNSGRDSVLAALDYLQNYSGTKIFVMAHMIELGDQSHDIHQEIAKKAGDICDYVFTISVDYKDAMQAGLEQSSIIPENYALAISQSAAIAKIMPLLDHTTVVLLSGRGPHTLRSQLQK